MERGAACVGMGWKWMGWDMDGIERGTVGKVGRYSRYSTGRSSAAQQSAVQRASARNLPTT